jgi:urea transporter
MISYSGTITSAATAQAGQTLRVGIWARHTDPASSNRFDTWWTGAASLTFWNSGTSSVSYAYSQSGGQTTGSSAGSNLMTASVMGARQIIFPINSTMSAGLYVIGLVNSTSSAGYSAAMSRMALYMDNPLSLGQGTFGQATNNSIGYADGGTYGTTTAGLPASIELSQIKQQANVMPYFKIGAL